MLTELRGFKFVTTIVLVFKKIESDNKRKCFWKLIINQSEIDDVFESI